MALDERRKQRPGFGCAIPLEDGAATGEILIVSRQHEQIPDASALQRPAMPVFVFLTQLLHGRTGWLAEPTLENAGQDRSSRAQGLMVQTPEMKVALRGARALLQHVEFFTRVVDAEGIVGERSFKCRELRETVAPARPTLELPSRERSFFDGHRMKSLGIGGIAYGCPEFRSLCNAMVLAQKNEPRLSDRRLQHLRPGP